MKKFGKLAALAMAATLLATSFAGCGDDSGTTSGSTGGNKSGDYDFYIFNTKGENADALDAAVAAYEEETGLTIKTFSLGSGTNSDDTLRAEMSSKNPPAIFCTMNTNSLVEWEEGGFARPIEEAVTDDFKTLATEIPDNLKLISGTSGESFGLPFNVEGYGYIVDKNMLSDLFGADKLDAVLEDLKAATYDEFAATVEALTAYIKDNKASEVTLNGNKYALAATKTGLATNLEGVFSMAGSEKWTYGDHLINIAIDAVFPFSYDAAAATKEDVEKLKGPFLAYAKTLDLKSSNAIGTRGPEFINSTTNGYDASVENFATGKAVFLKQGNWIYTNFANTSNPDVVEDLTFIPIKMPFTDADVVADGLTVEKMNTSIPVFVPNYYLINAKVSEEEQKMAEDFLVWLNTSEAGQKFVTEDMAFIPYNADPATTKIDNSLGNSIIEYMADDAMITNAYAGAPNTWSGDVVGLYIMENKLTKAEWTEEDYEDIANYAVDQWLEMANLS